MTYTPYVDTDDIKSWLSITTGTTDAEIASACLAGSRRLDRDCGRLRIFQRDVTGARIYRATHPEILQVHDIATDEDLVVEVGSGSSWTTLADGAYELLPENCVADGVPAEAIRRVDGCWPAGRNPARVRVTPSAWGWAALPDEIPAAAKLAVARLLRRKDSPEGVAGFSDLGVVRVGRYDPDYDILIADFVRKPV